MNGSYKNLGSVTPQAELFVRQRERPGLHSQAVAWPPRRSAGRREAGSQRPCLGEAAPPPEGSSVCAQKAPARLGFPGALPQRRVVWMWFGAFPGRTVYFLGKTLLVFVLLHSVFQGQICLLLQVFLDFLLLHSSPLYEKDIFLGC